MAVYRIAISCTYGTQTIRNAAVTSANSFLAGYAYTPVVGRFPAGVNTSGTTVMTISIEVDEADAISLFNSLQTLVGVTNRNSNPSYMNCYRKPE